MADCSLKGCESGAGENEMYEKLLDSIQLPLDIEDIQLTLLRVNC